MFKTVLFAAFAVVSTATDVPFHETAPACDGEISETEVGHRAVFTSTKGWGLKKFPKFKTWMNGDALKFKPEEVVL